MNFALRLKLLQLDLFGISTLRSRLLIFSLISQGSLGVLSFTSGIAAHWLCLLAAVLSWLLAALTNWLLFWFLWKDNFRAANRSKILWNASSAFLFFGKLQIEITFWLSSFRFKVFLCEDRMNYLKFTCLSFTKSFRENRFRCFRYID